MNLVLVACPAENRLMERCMAVHGKCDRAAKSRMPPRYPESSRHKRISIRDADRWGRNIARVITDSKALKGILHKYVGVRRCRMREYDVGGITRRSRAVKRIDNA